MVQQADSTLVAIKKKVRRLTASASTSALSENDLEQYINTFYSNDFPYAIKLDQMRSVYTFYTEPYKDIYPLDVNYNQGVRAPMYVDGIQGYFFKDRQQFFNMWPRWPTKFEQSAQSLTGSITGVTNANPCQITSTSHGLVTGDVVTIENVGGTVQINDNIYTITVLDANNFTLDGVDSTLFGVYTSGGTWTATNRSFDFTISGVPFLSDNVIVGGVDQNGNAISIQDNGSGILQYVSPNAQVSFPVETSTAPGMKNLNTQNPGQNILTNIGTVDYVTGEFSFMLPNGIALDDGTLLTIRVSQYSTGRPYTLLFWNNEFTIRPIPKEIHKVEIETYLTPVQFLESTDSPILNQWWQYIAYGVACEILRDRQDLEGVANLQEGFQRQEALVLERQGIEEIGQRNTTIYTQTVQSLGWNAGFGQGWM